MDAPITLSGAITFNISNVLAALAVLHGSGVSVDAIRNGISTFHPSATQNPGRMNIIDFVTFKVLLDYGHNVPAVKAIANTLPHVTKAQKIPVVHGTGNRLDEGIKVLGATLTQVYDHLIVNDADPRQRDLGETPELVRTGALENWLSVNKLEVVCDPYEAIDRAFSIGDLIVVQIDAMSPMHKRVMEHFERIVGTLPSMMLSS